MLSKQLRLNPSQRPSVRAIVYVLVIFDNIARKAQGLNVANVATTAPSNRKDMIGREFYIGSTTSKAFVTVMVTKFLPLCGRIRTTVPRLSGSPSIFCGGSFPSIIGIIPVFFRFISRRLWIFPISFPATGAISLSGLSFVNMIVFGHFVWVLGSPPRHGYIVFSLVVLLPLLPSLNLARAAVPSVSFPIVTATLFTRLAVLCSHKKIPLPECLTRGLYGTISSGHLPWPRVLKLLEQLSGLLFITPVIIPKCRGIG